MQHAALAAGGAMAFQSKLESLVAHLDATTHETEIARLRQCRSPGDLDAIATQGGWLTPVGAKRIKLLKHGTQTYLLVEYEDGWSTRLGQATF